MKKAELIALGISEETADQILALHGKGIEKFKEAVTTAESQRDEYKGLLDAANTEIGTYKTMDIEGIKKAATDWEATAKQAQADADAKVAALKFDHALDGALAGMKAKNPKAVKALLDMETLKKAYDEKTGTILGFDEHIKPVKTENEYLFEDGKEIKIVAGGTNQSVVGDAFDAAMLKGAGFKPS